jgi:lipopolysaccharide/colanic/teichoic acid biosynthesis glycosyltransferase
VLKRLIDVTGSAIGLVVLSPVLLGVGLATVIDSGWPVIFRQRRVGRMGRIFHLCKIRTMKRSQGGALITVRGDSRVTWVGRILRKTKIDELPQLWNVLLGDMSLVGPRPEVPEYVELYKERYRKILAVRPGITDLASIYFRNEEAILAQSKDPLREYRERVLPVKLDLADKYIQERSIRGDFAIIVRTAIVTVCPGAWFKEN